MAKSHLLYKQNKISKAEYISQLKSLGADQDTLNTAAQTAQFIVPSTKSPLSLINNVMSPMTNSWNNIADLYQQAQETTYWCGPATCSSILQAWMNTGYSQSSLTSSLHCSTDGTPWYDGTWPMADTLNAYENTTYYVPYGTTVAASNLLTYVTKQVKKGMKSWENSASLL